MEKKSYNQERNEMIILFCLSIVHFLSFQNLFLFYER
jgi:hypothetical protein